jgi:hypothetical protein
MDLYITLNTKVSLQHFEEIMVSALEGGSTYWYLIDTDEFKDKLEGEKGEPLSTRIAESLFTNPNFEMNVYDTEEYGEDEDGRIGSLHSAFLGTITQASMLKAIGTAHQAYPNVFHDLMEGTGDANTADVLFQLAVMNDVVFG